MQVADGIYQVQLPLPFPLRFVNCYLLRDGDAWTLLDCGLNYPPGQATWLAAFADLDLDPTTISRIILTHAHPDHYGMAGWLAGLSGAPVLLSAPEQAFARRAWLRGVPSFRATVALFRDHGMPDDLADVVYADMLALRQMTHPLPIMHTLVPGAQISVGQRRFSTIMTPGHSDGHLIFYCAEERLLLCGDAVLSRITPNVSLWPQGRRDPLADFLQSLDRMAELEVALALPGHGPLIETFHTRLAELHAHHEERLAAIERAAADGETAYRICTSIFQTGDLSPHQIRFALAETLAHLTYLVGRGRLERVRRRVGPIYRRV